MNDLIYRWKLHHQHVMDRYNRRFLLRGLYRFAEVFGMVLVVLVAILALALAVCGPVWLAMATRDPSWLMIYGLHVIGWIAYLAVSE